MKYLTIGLIIILAALQYELWFSNSGVHQYLALKQTLSEQRQENAQLIQRNQALAAEIDNLKHGREAIEEHARNDLGMVKKDETFYQVITPANSNNT